MDAWFSSKLIKWYHENKRDLPWRHQNDAYFIWISEIILQQTQVAQGLAYYYRFTKAFPTVQKLAAASEDEILKLWQGLGYYSRARNLHATAKIVAGQYNGIFPSSFEQIKELKGIGDYTASAIASFAFNKPHAVVDGNVYRVLSRVFGIETPIDISSAKKQYQELADQLLNKKEPAIHNQAIMEFGSQYCKPVNPDCENCVFNAKCLAFKTGKVSLLPIKIKKIKTRNRYFNYIVIIDKDKNVLLHRRGENDIWRGLYEFNLIETDAEITPEILFASTAFKQVVNEGFSVLHVSSAYKHILSHQHLYARFYVVKVPGSFTKKAPHIALKHLKKYAFSRLTEKFLDDCVLKELF